MSERKMVKRSRTSSDPINFYYQPGKITKPHPKVKQLKKGQVIAGQYETSFVNEEWGTKTHLIKTEAEGKVTVKGGQGLNDDMEGIPRGTYVEITYRGTGKAKPGRRPPYIFDVEHEEFDEKAAKAKSSKAAPTEEELEEESPLDEVSEALDEEEDLTF